VCEHEATRSEYTTEHMVCEDITAFRMEHHHQSSSWRRFHPTSYSRVRCPSRRHTRVLVVYVERFMKQQGCNCMPSTHHNSSVRV
jgi:hypothetical protein